jgi:phospholipid/cholesterol/gamma-HCH transport system substrate-binding protein
VPLPPAPPGARTVPLGPLPGPPDFTPGIAPLPPALTGPPPPPGPGPDAGPAGTPPLPGNPPYLPPGSWGG